MHLFITMYLFRWRRKVDLWRIWFWPWKPFSSRETVLSISQQIGVGKVRHLLSSRTHHFETIENEELEGCDSEDEELAEEIESCVQVSGEEYQERV